MRIAIHQPKMTYFSGGAEKTAMLLASHWSRNGTEITLVVARAMNQDFRNFLRDFRGNCYKYPLLRSDMEPLRTMQLIFPTLPLYRRVLSPQYYWDVERISFNLFSRWVYASLPYDVLSVHYYMDLFSLPTKKPILFHFQGIHAFPWATGLLRRATRHLACSGYIRDRVREFHRIEAEVVYNPVDCRRFSPGSGEKSYDVLFVGRFYASKGIATLLALARERTQTRFAVVGTGPLEKQIQEEASRLTNLVFLGEKEYSEMPAVYRSAKMLICPSYSDPFPLVVLEAMASGIPVVASRVGGIPEAVDDQVGRLVDPGDVAEFSRQITALLSDPALREGLGEAARERCLGRFSIKKIAPQVLDFYTDLARKGS